MNLIDFVFFKLLWFLLLGLLVALELAIIARLLQEATREALEDVVATREDMEVRAALEEVRTSELYFKSF